MYKLIFIFVLFFIFTCLITSNIYDNFNKKNIMFVLKCTVKLKKKKYN